jgi:hypothetical protein
MAKKLAKGRNAVHGDLDQSKKQAEKDFPIRHVSQERPEFRVLLSPYHNCCYPPAGVRLSC